MKAVVYRVNEVHVYSANRTVAETGLGFAVLLCVEAADTVETAKEMAQRVAALPAYQNRNGQMTETVEFVRGEVTVIPSKQPLYATGHQKKLHIADAASVNSCCEAFIAHFSAQRLRCGCVQADIPVSLQMDMDGAVSFYLDSDSMEV